MSITTAEVFGYLSASLWFVSALIRLPSNVWFQAHVGGGGRNEKFETLVRRLQTMSWLNAGAAFCAAVSLLCQTRGLS
jgi:hypothetical protein